MKSIPDIRPLYRPLQPTISPDQPEVSYLELPPHDSLMPLVYCYWFLKSNSKLREPFHYKVVADGCIDLFFELDQPDKSFVMGTSTTYIEFPLENSFHYTGVRFLPTAFPQLFGINASELTDRFEELASLLPGLSVFIRENFHERLSPGEVKAVWDNYFIRHLSSVTFNADKRLYEAIDIILKNQGVVALGKSLDTGLSQRQLLHLFEFYVGDSAKTFSKIVRFQNLLRAIPSKETYQKNKAFYDAGYYDQAHFIKEFKTFYGETPSKVL